MKEYKITLENGDYFITRKSDQLCKRGGLHIIRCPLGRSVKSRYAVKALALIQFRDSARCIERDTKPLRNRSTHFFEVIHRTFDLIILSVHR